ncbi:PAS domain-containing protein [Streptomyces hoynatensis]|uniref:PAS domain-containing protein n=1 Tax=Streptomyces hoynatensis TaxID=1141874 RepID=A0A3A9YX00_9ACTN|nr:PAS domain-containing protein [Streptomyces hoynatensis]RKN40154.1 PAS domain-containing protein [Streptomyces hoynatensis]
MADTDEFAAELADFRKRVEELRAMRTLPFEERIGALDAALFELHYAADVLWPRFEELEGAHAHSESAAGGREQRLLRALFQRLPFAAVLLDADSVVRRLNAAACRLFGVRGGYATGRPLIASLRHEGRAAFRGQVAAVARGEGDRSMVVQLLRAPEPHGASGLRVTLSGVRPSGERRRAVLAVFQTAAETAVAAPLAAPAGGPHQGRPDPVEVSRHAELMDLVDDMATVLLTHRAVGAEQVLRRACGVLRGRFADWVLADAAEAGGERLRRVAVFGPAEGQARARRDALAGQSPEAAPLIVEAARSGGNAVRVWPEDPLALGKTADGASVLAATGASSLLCVPLLLPSGTVRGVLTLIRSGGNRAFELAEAGAMDRMARHIALALLHAS